ncbi:TRAP transporter substrate-binding protein [Propionimicrobium sp. PCR01-08-3]|uniref:TRAP transporter substrate-binding protein n=1 Tax=Propionimicrobium sp. PCR01-08-3 TaxID=3052086 RepID=UPI00255C4315|nr:TRAP transporter substrate-binding protein [Propionimicrobium sp. PCR01-08-3]WIY81738.1 TRAP transporter substrate-binding protein [Propionimicrobium sp. PCR01-08-3]
MKLSKAGLAATIGLICLGITACGGSGDASNGGGATTIWKLAFNQTEDHPQFKAAEQLGELLDDATDGRYTIKPYANEQLGSQTQAITNVSDGTIEMIWASSGTLENFNQDFIVFNLPYVFDSVEAQEAVLAQPDKLQELYTSLEDSKNMTVLTGVHAGVRNIYNSVRPIREPADLNGLKIRVQQSESQVKMIELMGAVASPLDTGEIYSALQTGVLDGSENNETVFASLKHAEVAKYYSYTRHLLIPDYLIVSTSALDAMSDEDRQALLNLVPQAQQTANDLFAEFVTTSIADAEGSAVEFNDDVDVDAFKENVKPLIDESVAANDLRQELYAMVENANEAAAA